jgi:hypothetical protein
MVTKMVRRFQQIAPETRHNFHDVIGSKRSFAHATYPHADPPTSARPQMGRELREPTAHATRWISMPTNYLQGLPVSTVG